MNSSSWGSLMVYFVSVRDHSVWTCERMNFWKYLQQSTWLPAVWESNAPWKLWTHWNPDRWCIYKNPSKEISLFVNESPSIYLSPLSKLWNQNVFWSLLFDSWNQFNHINILINHQRSLTAKHLYTIDLNPQNFKSKMLSILPTNDG